MRHIKLNVDEELFLKIKSDKLKMEAKKGYSMTWDEYTKYLFNLK